MRGAREAYASALGTSLAQTPVGIAKVSRWVLSSSRVVPLPGAFRNPFRPTRPALCAPQGFGPRLRWNRRPEAASLPSLGVKFGLVTNATRTHNTRPDADGNSCAGPAPLSPGSSSAMNLLQMGLAC